MSMGDPDKAQAIAASSKEVGRLDKQIAVVAMKTAHGVFAQSNRRDRKVALRHAAFVNTVRRLRGVAHQRSSWPMVKHHSMQTAFPSVTVKANGQEPQAEASRLQAGAARLRA